MAKNKRLIDVRVTLWSEPGDLQRQVACNVVAIRSSNARIGKKSARQHKRSAEEAIATLSVVENMLFVSSDKTAPGPKCEREMMYIETEEHLFIKYAEKVFVRNKRDCRVGDPVRIATGASKCLRKGRQ